MSKTTDRKPSEWKELPSLQPKIQWLTQGDHNLIESEGVVCNLGFDQHCLVEKSSGKSKAFENAKPNELKMSSLVRLMDLNFLSEEFEYRTRASLSGELGHLLSGKHVSKDETTLSEHSPILSHRNMQEDDNLLKSASTEHAHHSREKEPKELDWKNGAPSPESILSYDFPNDSSYSVRQLDCQSDFTEGTNGLSLAPFGSNVGNPSNGPRSRAFSTDASLSGFASGDAWDPNETLSTQERSETQDEFEEHSLNGLLPGFGTEDTSFEHTPQTAVLHLHDIHTNNINALNSINTNTIQHTSRSPVLSTVLECSGTSEFSRNSRLGGRDTFSATVATPLSPDTLFGETVHPHNQSSAKVVVDTLVVPTALNSASKGLILEVLAEHGTEVKRVHSSAVALVTSYLTTEEARDSLIRNVGYLRVLVLEASAGIVSAAVVIVETPLQSDLADLNNNNNSNNTSTSTNTNNSSSPCSASHTASIPSSAISTADPPSSLHNNSSARDNDNSAAVESSASPHSTYTNSSNSAIATNDTNHSGSKTSRTTVSTPVGMQESTYVLSDSAYVPSQPTTEHVSHGSAEDTDVQKRDTLHDVNDGTHTFLPSLSEDSADYNYQKNNKNSSVAATNFSGDSHTTSTCSPSPALPLARSVVVRVECAVWSHYNTDNSQDSLHHAAAATTKALPLQDHNYSKAKKDSDPASGQAAGAEGNKPSTQDLPTELVSCIEMLLAQQASMHSPFQSTNPSTTLDNAATNSASTTTLPRRRASYHSLELDQRLFGHITAAALHDLEATANRMDMQSRGGGDTSNMEGRCVGALEVPVPVPVLDAVLFWSSDFAAEITTTLATYAEATSADHTNTFNYALLQAVQATVQPHLRDPSDFLTTNKADLLASQVTVEGSYIALSLLTMQMRQQRRDRAVQQPSAHITPMLPLYILPTTAVLQGASILHSLPLDVLRVYECNNANELQGGKLVLDTPAVGIIVRRTCANSNPSTTRSDIIPGEEVIGLYNPVVAAAAAAAAIGGDGYAALARAGRECSLLLTTNTINSTATSTTIKAEPCSVSRRSCPLKPSVSVRAFVQHPPPDTACVVQPASATYRSDAFLPASPTAGGDCSRRSLSNETSVDSNGGVRKGNLFFPATQTASASVAPSTAHLNVSLLDTVVGLYAAVCNRLHYLVFPGSTYYIQYFQADVSVTAGCTADSSVNVKHTPGVQTVAVNNLPTPITAAATISTLTTTTNTNVNTSSTWELLIVTQPTLDYGTTNNIRIVNTYTLPTEPSYCRHLIAQEEGNMEDEKAAVCTKTGELPPCLVSLSAADSAGIRSVVVKTLAGPSSDVASDQQNPTTTSTTSKRNKKRPTVQKRHYVELTHSSFQLLQLREKNQREIRSVRNFVQAFVLLVLSLGALLMFVMLMEVMWVQRQYAVQDVVAPTVPTELPSAIDTDITTANNDAKLGSTRPPAPIRRIPTITTTSTFTSTSSFATTTSQSKANYHTNSKQRVYYHTCKMNPVDPFLPAVCSTYVTNEATSELTVVVEQEEDILQLPDESVREGADKESSMGAFDTAQDTDCADTTTVTSRDGQGSDSSDSRPTVSIPAHQPSQTTQPIGAAAEAEPIITSEIAPTAVPETVPLVQHDCGIILPPDLGIVTAPSLISVVVEAEVVGSAEAFTDVTVSDDAEGVTQEDNTLSDDAKVKAVFAQMDSVGSFDYSAKEKLLADLEEIAMMTKEIVQMLDAQGVSDEPDSLLAGELCLYDLEAEVLQDPEREEAELGTSYATDPATITVPSTVVAASTEVTTATDTSPAYERWSAVFGVLQTQPKAPYSTRLSAVRQSVRDFVHTITPMCIYYLHQCQLHLQYYYHCSAEYLHLRQEQFRDWSAHTTHEAQRALQHTAYTITTSPFSKALQRHYTTLHTTIAHTIHTYYPIIYKTLHLNELSTWAQGTAAVVKDDLYSLYEVTHIKALSDWLHTHSATFRTQLSAQRRATLKSQQELLLHGRQGWDILLNASAQHANRLQRAALSCGDRVRTTVCEQVTMVYTSAGSVVEGCRVWGAQALLAMQRAVAGILAGLNQLGNSIVYK